jgi:hypothetical protein
MLSTLFDKVTGLFDKRFTLALLLPAFAFAAGCGALAATMAGWQRTVTWWSALDAARQVALGVGAAAAIVVLAVLAGTQVVAVTRLLEGYWRWPVDRTLGALGRRLEGNRRKRLDGDGSNEGFQRSYTAFPAAPAPVLPTRLGNALRAAESYPGDQQRWGIDAVFWWPRLYLILPDSTRDQVDEARAGLDQMVVLTMVSAVFGVVALALGFAGLNWTVALSCAGGALLLARASYLAAVSSAAVFGDLVRSCYDLYRGDLLSKLGWPMPPALEDERRLWRALGQQLYRGDVDQKDEPVIYAPRNSPLQPRGEHGCRPELGSGAAGQVGGQGGERRADRNRAAGAGDLPGVPAVGGGEGEGRAAAHHGTTRGHVVKQQAQELRRQVGERRAGVQVDRVDVDLAGAQPRELAGSHGQALPGDDVRVPGGVPARAVADVVQGGGEKTGRCGDPVPQLGGRERRPGDDASLASFVGGIHPPLFPAARPLRQVAQRVSVGGQVRQQVAAGPAG